MGAYDMTETKLKIGWAQADITPDEPVYIIGQFHARVSEGVLDPITATALVLDSGDEHVVLVSIDTVAVGEALREAIAERLDGPAPDALVMNATHTHTAPPTRGESFTEEQPYGVDLPVMDVADYIEFAAERIADAINEAWADRAEGSVAFGLGHDVWRHRHP
jgi:predicted neutral ceramidase superfamily lipid hydrolase